VAPDAAAQHEIDRLTAEVDRLRALERDLLAERERIRAESATEVAYLQDALRTAAGHAQTADVDPRELTHELAERAQHVAERERGLHERETALESSEAEIAALETRLAREREALADLRIRLDEEKTRLADERRRLVQESDRLAEWEREALRGGPAIPLPVTFREGLTRLSESGGPRGTSSEGSW